eukprot:3931661-Rhodomonas_salina.1
MVSWIHIFSEFDVIANENNTVAYPYYGFGKLNASRFASGVHLVRDPLKSITSLSCAVLRMTHETRRNASMSLSFRCDPLSPKTFDLQGPGLTQIPALPGNSLSDTQG